MRIGILAYGSLIDDLGAEIRGVLAETRSGVTTPFRVEYAYSSETRKGAPTLVPVESGGAYVQAVLLVLRHEVSAAKATDMLYRRETRKSGAHYVVDSGKPRQVYIERLIDSFGLDVVLYTRIASNIEPLTADTLADLAIKSARSQCGRDKRDGISYLRCAIYNGIQTPLTRDYRAKVLERTGAPDLESAWGKVVEGET
jgi:hypothetical protein